MVAATAACCGVAPGRERVGLRIVHQVDARHRQAGALRQLAHQAHELGRGPLVDLVGAVHRQHELVGVPVGEQVHAGGDQQGDHGAGLAADQEADTHEQGGEPCQQDGGTHIVHRRSPWPRPLAQMAQHANAPAPAWVRHLGGNVGWAASRRKMPPHRAAAGSALP